MDTRNCLPRVHLDTATSLGPSKEAIHYNLKNKDIEPLSHNETYKPNQTGTFLGQGRKRAHELPLYMRSLLHLT